MLVKLLKVADLHGDTRNSDWTNKLYHVQLVQNGISAILHQEDTGLTLTTSFVDKVIIHHDEFILQTANSRYIFDIV